MTLSIREKAGYGLGDTASNLIFDMVVLFLMYFYTDVAGLPPAAVGTLFLVTRVFDSIVDFSMGLVADRTRTRWGQFRPWLLWMAVPLGAIAALTFWSPAGDANGKLIYAWVTYSLLMVAYSAINIPYGALSGVMTTNPLDRTGLNAWRMGMARMGAVIVSGLTVWLVTKTGHGDEARGYFITMAIYAGVAILLYFICFSMTRERVIPPERANPVSVDLRMLIANRPWLIMFGLGIVVFANMVISLSSTIYFVRDYIGDPALISTFMLAGSLATFLGVPFTRSCVRMVGKKTTFVAANIGTAALMTVMYLLPADEVYTILITRVAAFSLIWLSAPLLWTMIGDTADYAECRLGVRATGVIFSAAACAHKMGMGLGGAIVGWVLAAYGYADGGPQSETTIEGIRILHCLVPAGGSVLLAAIMLIYPLTENDCAAFDQQLGRQQETLSA